MERYKIVDALRILVGAIHKKCHGAYGAGDVSYQGEYETEIQRLADAMVEEKTEA